MTARGMARCGSCASSPIDAAISKPMKSVTAKRMPLKTLFQDVSAGVEDLQGVHVGAALEDHDDRRDDQRDRRQRGEQEHAAHGQPDAEVVQARRDDQADGAPDPPLHPVERRPVGGEEALRQEAVGDEARRAPPEEEQAERVEAGRHDADVGAAAADDVLVDRPGARVAPRVDRDRRSRGTARRSPPNRTESGVLKPGLARDRARDRRRPRRSGRRPATGRSRGSWTAASRRGGRARRRTAARRTSSPSPGRDG